MTTITADGAAFTYAPAEEIAAWGGSPGPQQYMTTFTPPSPNGGVLIYSYTGGWPNQSPFSSIDDVANPERRFLTDLYNLGWVIVTPGLTGNPAGSSQGLHSSYGGTRFVSFTGESWYERDLWFVIQKVHQMIDDATLDGRHGLVGAHGVSATFIAYANIAFGPVGQNFWTSGSAQLQQIPRLMFLAGHSPSTWFPAYTQDEWPLGAHMESSPGSGSPPAPPYGLDLVQLSTQIEVSVLGRLQERIDAAGSSPPLPLPPMYLYATEAPTTAPVGTFDEDGYPTLFDAIRGPGSGGQLHDYWFSWILKRKHDQHWGSWSRFNRLATLPGFSYAAPNDDEDLIYAGLNDSDFQDDLRDWIHRRLTGAENPDWTGSQALYGSTNTSGGTGGRLVQSIGSVV